MIGQLLLGLVLSAVMGGLGYWRRSLTVSGVVGAVLVGTLIFGFGGWIWGLLLITFFVSSSWLSHYRRADKEAVADKFAKGSRRDLGQALANGGLGAVLAVAYAQPARSAALCRLSGGDGHRQRRHLGHRAGRPQPCAAPADHHAARWCRPAPRAG